MRQPGDVYREGYEKGRNDNLAGNVSEAVFSIFRTIQANISLQATTTASGEQSSIRQSEFIQGRTTAPRVQNLFPLGSQTDQSGRTAITTRCITE